MNVLLRSLRASLRSLPLLLLVGLAACASSPPEPPVQHEQIAVIALPLDWDTRRPLAFEAWVESIPAFESGQESTGYALSMRDRKVLSTALEAPGVRAVRAAVVLGRSGSADESLFALLERRTPELERSDDAASIVAAAALGQHGERGGHRDRLVALATGDAPHPDLEVRVECAASALALGANEPLPFLLQVLRIDTWDGTLDERDFAPSTTTAWPRERAAEALAARAGHPNEYRADASIEERQNVALALGRVLGIELPSAAE